MSKKWVLRGAAVIIMGAAFAIPVTRDTILHAARVLSSADLEPVKAYILSFGPLAAIVSFSLMIAQSVAAPFPAFLITLANAALFGWQRGAALSWTSAMAGAALCFGLSRLFGRGLVEKLTGKAALESIDGFFLKYGAWSIGLARLLPFVPFDPVSYAAGLTKMRFWPFFLATGLGQLPATLVYSYAGENLGGGAKLLFNGLCILFAMSAAAFFARAIYRKRKHKNVETYINVDNGADNENRE